MFRTAPNRDPKKKSWADEVEDELEFTNGNRDQPAPTVAPEPDLDGGDGDDGGWVQSAKGKGKGKGKAKSTTGWSDVTNQGFWWIVLGFSTLGWVYGSGFSEILPINETTLLLKSNTRTLASSIFTRATLPIHGRRHTNPLQVLPASVGRRLIFRIAFYGVTKLFPCKSLDLEMFSTPFFLLYITLESVGATVW
jgi:hypothetical protein